MSCALKSNALIPQAIVAPTTDGFRYAEGLPLFKDRMRVIPEAADGLKAIARDQAPCSRGRNREFRGVGASKDGAAIPSGRDGTS